jgi:inward rectifier potassium channel
MRREVFRDLYHALLNLGWLGLMGVIVALYAVLNMVFAGLYLLGGDCIAGARPGHVGDALAFSVQTFATIGYGVFAPRTPWAHGVVAVEALAGIVFGAVATGLMFAKFARPTAKVIFSAVVPISDHDGVPTVMFRMANARFNQIYEATARVRLMRNTVTPEGVVMRRFSDLRLVRDSSPTFALTWTIFHPIDEQSPLRADTAETLARDGAMFVVSITGTDDTMMQTVHARRAFYAEHVRFGTRFADILSRAEDGRLRVDYGKFDDVIAVPAPAR